MSKEYVEMSYDGMTFRVCPICGTGLTYAPGGKIHHNTWYNDKLAIACCKCIDLINYIKIIEINFKHLLKETAIIKVDDPRQTFFYTEDEIEKYVLHYINIRYGSINQRVFDNLTKWGIL